MLKNPRRIDWHAFRWLFLAVLFLAGSKTGLAQLKPALADSFLRFVQNNRPRVSMVISRNDTNLALLNAQQAMPLASTVKILVAIEFADQVAAGHLREDSMVLLKELDHYYLALTDGGAHPRWLAYERTQQHINGERISLLNIARGMIMFSSNANTEFLGDLLGLERINQQRKKFALQRHTPLYPIVSSLFLYQNPGQLPEATVLTRVARMSDKKYRAAILRIHQRLKTDSAFKSSFRPFQLTPGMQQAWSKRLPAASASDYHKIAKALNNRQHLSAKAYQTLVAILEFPMESKSFQARFAWYGVKGGSTGSILTHVIYLTTVKNEKMELVIFFNQLSMAEEKQLEKWLDPFEAQVIFDENFRDILSHQFSFQM